MYISLRFQEDEYLSLGIHLDSDREHEILSRAHEKRFSCAEEPFFFSTHAPIGAPYLYNVRYEVFLR